MQLKHTSASQIVDLDHDPSGQTSQRTCFSLEFEPGAQSVHAEELELDSYLPGAQAAHTDDAAADACLPGEQAWHVLTFVAAEVAEKRPG